MQQKRYINKTIDRERMQRALQSEQASRPIVGAAREHEDTMSA